MNRNDKTLVLLMLFFGVGGLTLGIKAGDPTSILLSVFLVAWAGSTAYWWRR